MTSHRRSAFRSLLILALVLAAPVRGEEPPEYRFLIRVPVQVTQLPPDYDGAQLKCCLSKTCTEQPSSKCFSFTSVGCVVSPLAVIDGKIDQEAVVEVRAHKTKSGKTYSMTDYSAWGCMLQVGKAGGSLGFKYAGPEKDWNTLFQEGGNPWIFGWTFGPPVLRPVGRQ